MAESVQTPASEPGTFAEYREQKSAASLTHTAVEEQVETEPETVQEEKKEPDTTLTDEEKSDRRKKNDQRREKRWFEERGEMKERTRRLEQELAELKSSQSKTEAPAFQMEGKPVLKAFLDSGKFKTYEEAHEAFTDALTDWKMEGVRAEQESTRNAETQQAELKRLGKAYQDDVKTFEVDHADYGDIKAEVAERLDSPNDKGELVGNALTAAILKSKSPAKLIYHIGNNAELLEEFSEYAASGDFETALERLGEVKASLGIGKTAAKVEAAPEKKEPVNATRNPKHVGGRATVSNRDDQLRNAAEKNDFAAFRSASRAKRAT